MKILHILHANTLGGMEKVCIELCNILSKEHDVYLMTDLSFASRIAPSVNFIHIDIKARRNNPLTLWQFYKMIHAISPDIIHTHKQKSSYIIKWLYPFLKIPYVVTKHDMQIKKVYNKVPNVIAISDETAKTFKASNVYNIYTAVQKKDLPESNKESCFTIVAIGGLRHVKGFDKLIYSCQMLQFPFKLWIIGEGEDHHKLVSLISSLRMEDRVFLLGFKENVHEWIAKANLQVINSYSEGFSLAMIEGIFYADVLISTKVSGAIEVLPEILLTNQEDMLQKIIEVHNNYIYFKKLFQSVKMQWSSKLEMNYCKEEHVKVYQDIITKNQYISSC